MSDLSGGYTVIVERDFTGEALRWEGYAENPSDALHQALDLREEQVAGIKERPATDEEVKEWLG